MIRARLMVLCLSGALLGCFCLTEPHTGSDAAIIKTRAIKTDSGWTLNGVKQFITSGKNALIAIVFAARGFASPPVVPTTQPTVAALIKRGQETAQLVRTDRIHRQPKCTFQLIPR